MEFEILLDGIILTFLALALFLSIGIIILILLYLRPFSTNVSILLTFNTYFSLSLTSISMCIIYAYNLYGDLYSNVSVKNIWCELRAYFVNVSFCSLYFSCVLQSTFRLFRVVFYRRKALQSSRLFIRAIVLQWFLSILLIFSNLFNNDYQHLPRVYRCWISFQNARGLLIASTIIYACPLGTILLIYTCIIRYIRSEKHIQQIRKKSNERDLLVLKRMIIFVLVIIAIGLPTVSILFIWMASGKLIPMAYHLQGLSMSIGVFVASICFAFTTPQIQKIFSTKEQYINGVTIVNYYQSTTSKLSQSEVETAV